MIKKILAGVAVTAGLALPVAAFAATNITNLTLDGLSNTTVSAGDSITAKVTYDITSNDDVESLSWELVGSGLPKTCENVQDQLNSGTFHPSFDMDTTGATAGTWDVEIQLYGTNGPGVNQLCENPSDDSMTFTNVVAIEEADDSSGSTGNGGNGSGSGSSNTPAWLAAFQAQIAALIAALHPTTPPAPTGNAAKCAALADHMIGAQYGVRNSANGVLQGFLIGEHMSIPLLQNNQATYGFWANQTNDALMAYKGQYGCI